MALEDIPLFGMLRSRLGYLAERQRLIAENVANADTPGYTPRDLRPFTLPSQTSAAAASGGGGLAMTGTSPRHLAGTLQRARRPAFGTSETPDSETTMNGNSVVLEEQMMHMSEARIEYDAAIGFYQKSLNMLRMASRRPGS